MKFLAIGDIHGRNIWESFADISKLMDLSNDNSISPEYDKYIFLGDYVDSFDKKNEEIEKNLLRVIEFKKLYPDNVILLLGNHEVQYFLNPPWVSNIKYYCTGYRPEAHFNLYDIFNNNKDLFQVAYQYKNYLFVHAGVHYGWYHFVFNKAIKNMNFNDLNVAEQLNEAFKIKLDCIFDVDWYRGGRKRVGGPLWVSKELFGKKPLKNMHQIVGHTHIDKIKTFKIKDASITFCDVLTDNLGSYYEIDI